MQERVGELLFFLLHAAIFEKRKTYCTRLRLTIVVFLIPFVLSLETFPNTMMYRVSS